MGEAAGPEGRDAGVLGRLRRGRGERMVPHAGPVPSEQRTVVGKSGTLRASLFGMNDGLVSNLALIMGVTGAGAGNEVVLLAGVAGLLAGAFSMAAGEYVSMRAQREVFERLIHTEAHELWHSPDQEREELAAIYRSKGVPADVADRVAEALMRDPRTALETHAREELGLDPKEGLGSPWGAAVGSFLAFAFGAFVPVLPFLFGSGTGAATASAAASGTTLFAAGALISVFTGKRFYVSGARQLAVGAAAALVTFGVGRLLHVGNAI